MKPSLRKRRALLGAIALAAVTTPGAQPAKPRVVVLSDLDLEQDRRFFHQLFAEQGFATPAALQLEFEHWGSSPAEMEKRVDRIVTARPDVILVYRTLPAQLVAGRRRDLPVVFFGAADPDKVGLVANLREPGGNVTGVSSRFLELLGRRLEVLREVNPAARSVAVLAREGSKVAADARAALSATAARLGMRLQPIDGPEKLSREALIRALKASGADAFLSVDWAVPAAALRDFQVRAAMPGLFLNRENAVAGGLLAVGTSREDEARRAVALVARVLRGEKPATLAVDVGAREHVVLNRGTAEALGLRMPEAFLRRVDEVLD